MNRRSNLRSFARPQPQQQQPQAFVSSGFAVDFTGTGNNLQQVCRRSFNFLLDQIEKNSEISSSECKIIIDKWLFVVV